jgi:hypothetical protein
VMVRAYVSVPRNSREISPSHHTASFDSSWREDRSASDRRLRHGVLHWCGLTAPRVAQLSPLARYHLHISGCGTLAHARRRSIVFPLHPDARVHSEPI